MNRDNNQAAGRHPVPAAFCTTQWTRVCLAKADSEDGRKALADLCDAYYEPVVAYLRNLFRDDDAARETSHAFFAKMLAGGTIHTASSERGRFRSYLLGAVKHFVSHQRTAAQCLKRGGGKEIVSLENEEVAQVRDARVLSPDEEFDRQWAVTVIARSMEALRAECVAEGRGAFFDVMSRALNGHTTRGEQIALAAECEMTSESFRMALHRLKKRLRQCVSVEVASTLEDPGCIQHEMDTLFATLSR